MSHIKRTLITFAASVFVASAALAGPGDFQVGGNGPNKILKAQLGIKGPKTINDCSFTTMGWVFTNFAGPVQVMIARKGQSVGAPFTIHAKKAANGQYIASFTHQGQITGPINAQYRLLVKDGVMSNWVPLVSNGCVGGGGAPGFKAGG